MRAKSPNRSFSFPSPRPKPRLYKYLADDNPDLNKIVIDIIDGLNIDQIEPEIYPNLLPLLEERFVALQEWRSQPASRSLQAAINFIKEYRYSDDPKQLRPRAERKADGYANCGFYVENKDENPEKIEIDENVDFAIRGNFELINPDLYSAVSKELVRIKNDALQVKKYQLAEQAANAFRKLQTIGSENIFYEFTQQNLAERENRLFEKQVDFERTKEEWDEIIKNAEIKREKALKECQKENENEMMEFDKQYEENPPSSIYKYSSQVLELRARESYLVKAGRYTEATEYDKEATALEQAESEIHRKKWFEELDLKRIDKEKKLKEKYRIREQNANSYVQSLKLSAAKMLERNEKAIQHAEFNVDGATMMCSLGGNNQSSANLNSTSKSRTFKTLTKSSRLPSPPRSARNDISSNTKHASQNSTSRLPTLLFEQSSKPQQSSTLIGDSNFSNSIVNDSLLETAELAITSRRSAREAAMRKSQRGIQTSAMRFRQKAIMNNIVYSKVTPQQANE